MLNNLLVYRLIIVNLLGIVMVGVAVANGWVEQVIRNDTSHLIWAMLLVFLIFLASVANRASKVSHHLNALKAGKAVEINATKFLAKGEHLDDFPTWITLIGLLGNVIGIMVSLGAVSPSDLGNAASTQTAISGLMNGMHIAFSTTIVGCVFALWADVNRRVLKTAAVLMTEDARQSVLDRAGTTMFDFSPVFQAPAGFAPTSEPITEELVETEINKMAGAPV